MKISKITLVAVLGAAIAAPALSSNHGKPGGHFFDSWDENADGQVTLAELTERRDNVFDTFDNDENGELDAEEYVFFDQARADHHADDGQGQGHGQKGKGGEMMKLSANDLDGNGTVSRAEFVGNSKVMFANLDKNADGVITTADFKKK